MIEGRKEGKKERRKERNKERNEKAVGLCLLMGARTSFLFLPFRPKKHKKNIWGTGERGEKILPSTLLSEYIF